MTEEIDLVSVCIYNDSIKKFKTYHESGTEYSSPNYRPG
jgi:hypothetical protein